MYWSVLASQVAVTVRVCAWASAGAMTARIVASSLRAIQVDVAVARFRIPAAPLLEDALSIAFAVGGSQAPARVPVACQPAEAARSGRGVLRCEERFG